MIWINFLHLYQPANIDDYHIQEAYEKSYSRLLRLLQENKNLKMTFNISGCLIDRLAGMGYQQFISDLKKLNEEGRLELVSSAAYHAFLPLLPEKEVIKQIEENEFILKKFFGESFQAKGFFLPEMAYSPEVAEIIKRKKYQWIILDSISALGSNLNFNKVFRDVNSGLKVVFRNRELSRAYPPDEILKIKLTDKKIAITATDAELYGLRHEDPTGEMEKVLKDELIKTETISNFVESFWDNIEDINVRPSSWESEEADIKAGRPFALWYDNRNKIHKDLWKLSYLALSLEDKFPHDENKEYYRWHLVRGLASCTFWWASANDFSASFGPYAWNPDIVDRGLEDLIRSVRSLSDKKSLKYKLKAEALYISIKKDLWQKHWRLYWL